MRTQDLLDALAESARRPVGRGIALPPGIYTSDEIYRLEQERIFAAEWHCPGIAADIPEPGDYLTYTIGDQPIVVVRQQDGTIRSFSNVCLHRMTVLAEGRGNKRKLVCPYHAWTYALDGRLIGAGHMQRTEGFDKSAFCLPEIRTEIWEGWIYVTLNRTATSVAELLAPLLSAAAPYRMAGYIPVAHQDHVWKTNWKLVCENFMEGYHLPVAHRVTVGAWFPVNETGFDNAVHDGFTWQTFVKGEDARYGLAHADNTVLEGRWRSTSLLPTVYPAHMYVLAPDHFWYLSLRPNGVGETLVRFGIALAPEVHAALGHEREAWVAELLEFFDKVNGEDRTVVEAIYRGTRAPLARPGPLSWLEREIHDFAGYLARLLVPKGPLTKRAAAE